MNELMTLALLKEGTSAKNLLRGSLESIASIKFVDNSSDIVFTLASIGIEKLMKMSIGLIEFQDNGKWPSENRMRTMGHSIVSMNERLNCMLRKSLEEVKQRPYLEKFYNYVENDPYWPDLIKVFDAYGKSGRFYYLDSLANGYSPEKTSPLDYWDSVEIKILDDFPDIRSEIIHSYGIEHGQARARLNQKIAESFYCWWEMIYKFWALGAIGPIAKSCCSHIEPPRYKNDIGKQPIS